MSDIETWSTEGYLVRSNFMEKVYKKHTAKTSVIPLFDLFEDYFCYFSTNIYFSPNDSASKTIKSYVFYLI